MVKEHDLDPFFQSTLKLKSVKRAGWVSKVRVRSPESVADHTFATCSIAMLLADVLGADTERVMKMVILHDLAESVVGDYMPGDVSVSDKLQHEKKAMDGILSGLPTSVRSRYTEIWAEYLGNRTDVARFVHRIDKLEMAMQAGEYAAQGYDRKLLEPFLSSAKKAVGDSDDIVGRTLARFTSNF
jgi:putative hydrolases of HD superfamily